MKTRTPEQLAKHAERMRAWRLANPERIRAVNARCRAKNGWKYLQKQKERYRENAEARQQKQREAARTPAYRFTTSKRNARNRNIEWSLTLEQYTALISKRCHYCNDTAIPQVSCGLDRMDSSKGYQIDNVCSCCHDCNIAKGDDRFTYKEMLLIGQTIKLVKRMRVDPTIDLHPKEVDALQRASRRTYFPEMARRDEKRRAAMALAQRAG